jgi:CubicO group peptidase (beta-lactamase class C family)
VPRANGDVLLCLGIYGQMLYVSPGTGTVAAKLSTWPDAQSPEMLHDTLLAFDAIGATLAGGTADDLKRQPGPPGVVSGLSRGRTAGPDQ